jgi:hypothetical protein
VHLQIILGGRQIIEQNDRAATTREKMLQGQDLTAVAVGSALVGSVSIIISDPMFGLQHFVSLCDRMLTVSCLRSCRLISPTLSIRYSTDPTQQAGRLVITRPGTQYFY